MDPSKSTNINPITKPTDIKPVEKKSNWHTILYIVLGLVAAVLLVVLIVYSTSLAGGGGMKTRNIYGGN